MKNSMLAFLVFAPFAALAQIRDVSVCRTMPSEKFKLIASSRSFVDSQLIPRPYVHKSLYGKMITIKTENGPNAIAYFIPAKNKTDRWLFVFQEWWGLNDYIKKEAEKYYQDLGNVNVLALDMYDGKIARNAETAGDYIRAFQTERGHAIVQGALDYVGSNARIGTVGWCFGGGQAIQASLMAGNRAVGCVMYYGMPEDDVDRLKTLHCDVLGIYALQDWHITSAFTKKFEINMKAAGKTLLLKKYDDVHSFANPSNPDCNREYATDAYKAALVFFKERMK